MSILQSLFQDSAFLTALWEAVFQLVSLSIVAILGTFVFQRMRRRADGRQEIINEIDRFSTDLYKPRKMYQIEHERRDAASPDEGERALATKRAEFLHESLNELVGVIGRFRSIQVKFVPLYGYNENIFTHYLAIWWYLKAIRLRMQAGQDLFFHHADSRRVDAFYRLIDAFRYHVSTAKFVRRAPDRVRPPHDLLEKLYALSDEVYQEYFKQKPVRRDSQPNTPPDPSAASGAQ